MRTKTNVLPTSCQHLAHKNRALPHRCSQHHIFCEQNVARRWQDVGKILPTKYNVLPRLAHKKYGVANIDAATPYFCAQDVGKTSTSCQRLATSCPLKVWCCQHRCGDTLFLCARCWQDLGKTLVPPRRICQFFHGCRISPPPRCTRKHVS